MNRVPKLRFKEFSEEWEEKKLGEIFDVITDFVAAGSFATIRENVNYITNDIGYAQLIRTTDLKYKFENLDKIYVDEKAFNFLYRVNLDKECIILPNIGANIGESYYIQPNIFKEKNNVLGPNAILIRSNKNNNKFLINFFERKEYNKQLKIISGASGQPKFNKTDLKKFIFYIPVLQEQQKIADFLSSVDKKISITEEKLDLFKDYKKGIMQKIFNQELRFKDSNGNDYPEWEEKRLGNICYYFNGGSLESYVVNNGKYNLITLNSISIEGNLKKEHKTVNINKNLLNKYDLVMVLSDVAHGNFLGLTAIIPEDNMFVLNQRMGGLKIKYDENVYYLRYYINSNQFYFKLHGQGSSQLNLSKKDIEDFIVKLPCLEEQQKIADFLSSIDNKIDNLAAELENLKEFKKGLLQQMFV